MQSNCANCSGDFVCLKDNIQSCWCIDYPKILSAQDNPSCLCASCLQIKIQEKIENISKNYSIEDALENNWIKDIPKTQQLFEGIDYTIEKGFYVFTKWFHLKRGYCCKNNCRHCAYGFNNL